MTKSIANKSTTGSLPPAVPLAITPTFSPWTHTSDDSYIYQLSLVLATATVSLSPSRNPDAGSHSTPLPTTVRALLFHREKISAISSLVDSGRIVLTHARRSQQLIFFLFLQKKQNLATAGFELTDQH